MAGNVRTLTTKPVGYAPQVEKVPLLPGNNFHDDPINRKTLRKSHALQHNTIQDEFVPPTEYSVTNHPRDLQALRPAPPPQSLQEKWAPKDECLRFVGYFKEAVVESSIEDYRIRRVAICFYPADGTLLIREAKQVNSGMPTSVHGGGAVLVRRHKVYEEDGTPVELEDLQIGEEFECYGKVFKILDCDGYTRKALTDRGWVVPPPLPWPEDEDKAEQINKKRMAMSGVRALTTDNMDVKRQVEFALSGRVTKYHPDQTRAAQQFLAATGNRHLTFNVLWDDRGESKGDCRVMSMKYHLEDDTIELVENRVVNSGRDGSVKFLCRQRVALEPTALPNLSSAVQHNTYGTTLRAGFLTWKDVQIGKTLRIHGKEFLVYDADQYTREWYRQKGIELAPGMNVSGIVDRDKKQPVKHFPPPHNGFGDETDSLGNWKNLMLKPPRRNVQQLLEDGHKVLRFRAVLHNNTKPEDQARSFVVNYYLATEEVEVIESSVRNSGIVAGKFLARTKLYKEHPDTRQRTLLTKDDFFPGAVVHILGRDFELQDIDAKSVKYRDGIADPTSPTKVKQLLVTFKDLLNQRFERITEAFRAISTKGRIGVTDIEAFFKRSNHPISHAEAKTICSFYDTNKRGYLDHTDFVRCMEYSGSTNLDESSNNPKSIKLNTVLPEEEEDINDQADRELQYRQLVNSTLRKLRDRLLQRRMRQQEVYRLMAGCNTSSLLEQEEFEYGLANILHLQLTKDEHRVLINHLFGEKRSLTFAEFSEFLEGVHEFF
eukprot:Sspe_Gene.3831::Locus_1277_Transcript_1_2_Confidence_0.667_Length_2386::g.3831::m.3831